MQYKAVVCGSFVRRLNRFTALVLYQGSEELVHVKNTGRLGELLVPGACVYLNHSDAPGRKTKWDLIAVEHDGQIVNIDSQAPNRVFAEFLQSGQFRQDILKIRPEFTHGDSRFDFRLECESCIQFVEIKGVTLLRNGAAYFPDAPTERGVKHLHGLMRAVEEGAEATAVFVIQMKGVSALRPNDDTHPAFGQALRAAADAGVRVAAYDCQVTEHSLQIDRPIPVLL